MEQLKDIRTEIDAIDRELAALFLKRQALARSVGEYKRERDIPVYAPEREAEILSRFDGEEGERLKILFSTLMRLSREAQYGEGELHLPIQTELSVSKVCCMGSPGAYSHTAAKSLYRNCEIILKESFQRVIEAVQGGEADVGIIPVENSSVGMVAEAFQLLLHSELYMIGEYTLDAAHVLASKDGEWHHTVLSHQQALRQCKRYLTELGFLTESVRSTAFAAEYAKNNQVCALCSRLAAEINGLTVLAENVSEERNQTKFIVLARELVVRKDASVTALTLSVRHEKGALLHPMQILNDYGINMRSIQSHTGKNPWEYDFYIELDGSIEERRVVSGFLQLTAELPSVRLLGSYPVMEGICGK